MQDPQQKTPTRRPRPKAVAVIGSIAVLATAASVAVGVVAVDPSAARLTPVGAAAGPTSASSSSAPAAPATSAAAAEADRDDPVTRSEDRQKIAPPATAYAPSYMSKAAIKAAVSDATKHLYTTDDLNIWTQPGDKASKVGEIAAGKKVLVTGRSLWGRTEIVVDGESRWVTSSYLSKDKPLGAGAGLSMEPCPDSSVEDGLTAGAIYVYRSVCHAFPQITSYGGWAPRGEHASGKAIDIMTSDVTLGTAIAEFLQEHASELNLYDVIWRQHIWTPVRASEGWRLMPSRGSETANHYDHVHVSVN